MNSSRLFGLLEYHLHAIIIKNVDDEYIFDVENVDSRYISWLWNVDRMDFMLKRKAAAG